MKISGEFFSFLKKRRRDKMENHPNSQANGPKLDRTLERYLYHRRGNFLSYLLLLRYCQKNYSKYFLEKNLSGLKTESYI